MKTEYNITDAIESITAKLKDVQRIAELEIVDAVESRDQFVDFMQHIRDRMGIIDNLRNLDVAIQTVGRHYEGICENMGLQLDDGLSEQESTQLGKGLEKMVSDLSPSASVQPNNPLEKTTPSIPLRRFAVTITEGMLKQSLLTLTFEVKHRFIKSREKFEITFPNGAKIETELVQPGNRLRARGVIAEFYRENKIQPEDEIELRETERGKWLITVGRRLTAKIEDIVKELNL